MSNLTTKESRSSSAIYTIAEAARLCGLSTAQVRRWTSPRANKPATIGLDFLDLIELRYVKAFVEADVIWPVIRAAYERAAAILRVDHPLATERFFTDGHAILTRIAQIASLEIAIDQRAFSRIVSRYLAGEEGLDFDDSGVAIRWWPME